MIEMVEGIVRNVEQDAQNGQTSHPPNPGAPRRALPKQGRCFAADPRFTFHALRFTAPGNEARTLLAYFFSILLEGRPTLADYVAIGSVVLGDLQPGHWRDLTNSEIAQIYSVASRR